MLISIIRKNLGVHNQQLPIARFYFRGNFYKHGFKLGKTLGTVRCISRFANEKKKKTSMILTFVNLNVSSALVLDILLQSTKE